MSEIVDGLWGDDPPRTAHKAVQTTIVNLRRKLVEAVIVTTADGYLLDLPASDVDMHRFEQLIATSRMVAGRQEIAEAEELLVEALALWRGEPLGDLSATLTGRAEATRLSELKLLAEEEAADLALAQGRHAQLIAQLHAAVAASPLRERQVGSAHAWPCTGRAARLTPSAPTRGCEKSLATARHRAECRAGRPGGSHPVAESGDQLESPPGSWGVPGGASSPQSALPRG